MYSSIIPLLYTNPLVRMTSKHSENNRVVDIKARYTIKKSHLFGWASCWSEQDLDATWEMRGWRFYPFVLPTEFPKVRYILWFKNIWTRSNHQYQTFHVKSIYRQWENMSPYLFASFKRLRSGKCPLNSQCRSKGCGGNRGLSCSARNTACVPGRASVVCEKSTDELGQND